LKAFKDIIINRRRVEDHDGLMRFMKADEVIDARIADLYANSVDAKAITSKYQQIKLIRAMGAAFGFKPFDNTPGEFHMLDDQTYKLARRVLRVRRANPSNQEEAGKLFATLVNKVAFPKLVSYTKAGINWNINLVKQHLALNKHKNKNCLGFSPAVVEKFGLPVVENGLVVCANSPLDN
jgi:hypothetical protein